MFFNEFLTKGYKIMRVKASMLAIAAGVLAMAAGGCISQSGGITSSTIPITSKDQYTVIKKGVSGTSWSWGILGIPLWLPSGYRALQNAKMDNAADGMINVSVNNEVLSLILVSYHKIDIYGDAIKLQKNALENK
jgi:hypothetical protein